MTDVNIDELIRERDTYLKNNPSMVAYQAKIDMALNTGKTQADRMNIIARMLKKNLRDLQTHLFELVCDLNDLSEKK